MGNIVIKRKVSLDFIGEEYKDAYITFKAIPVKDYTELLDKMPKEDDKDNGKSIGLMVEMLQKYFFEGKFPNESGELAPLVKEDVADLDPQSAVTCFQTLVGQKLDPKV